MSLSITVTSFRGIRHAEFSCAPLALVAGLNAQGKSSIAQAVAACLTGRAIEDAFELRKSDIKDLVRDGSKGAAVQIVGDKGTALLRYPDAKLETQGDAPHATTFAAGLESVATMPLKDRPAVLSRYMKALPTKQDLLAAMQDEFDPETVGKCWAVIERDGWDATLKGIEDKRARARATWESITHEKFGTAKGKTWRPEGWSDDMFGAATVEVLESRVAEAKAKVEAAIGSRAVGASDVERLRELAGQLDAKRQALDEAKNLVSRVQAEKTAADEAVFNAPMPENFAPLCCPHCQGKIQLKQVGVGGAASAFGRLDLVKAEPSIDPGENQRRRQQMATLQGQQSNANDRLTTAKRALTIAEQEFAAAEDAAAKLDGAEATDDDGAEAAEAARAALREAETNLARLQRYEGAQEAYARWEANEAFCAVLGAGPDGLRAKKLAEATLVFNSQVLRRHCDLAGWGVVEITEDFRVTLDGRVYSLLSDSDQMRVRIILQVAMAKLDGSSMVVIDRAEALDGANKKKLMSLLIETDMKALVCMVAPNPTAVPDLAKAGVGTTMWVDQSEAKPLSAPAPAMAAE